MKEFTCIVCPKGCSLAVEEINGSFGVTGNSCKRGRDFALSEMTCPMRTVCSTVYTVFPEAPVLPVRTATEIPKDRIPDVMKEINAAIVERRTGRGEAVIKNVCDLGVDVIATSGILTDAADKK